MKHLHKPPTFLMELWHNSSSAKFPGLIKQGTHAFVYWASILLPSTLPPPAPTRHKQLSGSKQKQLSRWNLVPQLPKFYALEVGCRWSSFSSVRSPSPVATLWEFPGLKFWSQAELPWARTSLSWGGRELSSCLSRSISPGAGLGPQSTAPRVSPELREEAARVGSGHGGGELSSPGTRRCCRPLPLPPAGGPLPPSSPPKIGLTANRQSLTSFTAGDLWPIARGFFARSR